MQRGLMLNDGDCGFCMRTAALVPRLGVDVDSVALQSVDLSQWGIDEDRALVEMAYVHPDGNVDYGHRAWAAILTTGPLPWRAVARAMTTRAGEPVARRVYRWVADNRSRLPGGTPACSIENRPTSAG
jgi:predicted DCC family thiol-disulfide oxidoreductase YuxK